MSFKYIESLFKDTRTKAKTKTEKLHSETQTTGPVGKYLGLLSPFSNLQLYELMSSLDKLDECTFAVENRIQVLLYIQKICFNYYDWKISIDYSPDSVRQL